MRKQRDYNIRIIEQNGKLYIGFVHSLRKIKNAEVWTNIPGKKISKQLGIPLINKLSG